jgi:hypothetical protein
MNNIPLIVNTAGMNAHGLSNPIKVIEPRT